MASFSTVVVRFVRNAAKEEIVDLLDEHCLWGNLVSSQLNRWTVEVPVDQEEKYIKLLRQSDIVAHVFSNYIKGYKYKPKPKEEEDGHESGKNTAKKKNSGKW